MPTRAEIENLWRHWWAGQMRAVGATSRLPLDPISADILTVLNGGSHPPAPEPEPAQQNRATRRQQAHVERTARKRERSERKQQRVEPRPTINLPMADWAKRLVGDGRISDVTLDDVLVGLDDYFEIFAKLRKMSSDTYTYFARTGTPLWTHNINLFKSSFESTRIPNPEKLPSMFGFFSPKSKEEYRDEIINEKGSCLDFNYFEKVTRNYATIAPPGTTIFRENRIHLGRDAFTREEFRTIPSLRGQYNCLRTQWGWSWFVGVLPDGSIKALPCRLRHDQKLPSGDMVHHSSFEIPPVFYEWGKGDPHQWVLRCFVIGLALSASILSGVQVTIKRGGLAVRIGIPISHAKSFFADRVPDADARRKPILHLRAAHLRQLADGRQITVGDHLAGQRFFHWRGYEVKIAAAGIHEATPETFPDFILLEDGEQPPDPEDALSMKQAMDHLVPWLWDRGRKARFRRGEPIRKYTKDALLPLGDKAND